MSLSYWMIVGLGLSMKELFPYLQASKIRQRLREQKGSDLNMEDTALWGKSMTQNGLNCFWNT